MCQGIHTKSTSHLVKFPVGMKIFLYQILTALDTYLSNPSPASSNSPIAREKRIYGNLVRTFGVHVTDLYIYLV
jgi:hypothetical protein